MKKIKRLTLKELDSRLALAEGLKKETSIGNVREIRKALMTMIKDEIEDTGNSEIMLLLMGATNKDRRVLAGMIDDGLG